MPQPKAGAARLARQWMSLAQEDLSLAQHGLKMRSSVPYALLAYHAQQSVEKALKAYCVAADIDFPFTHNLEVLLKLCPAESGLHAKLHGAGKLTLYAVKARYPQDRPKVSKKQAEQAIAFAGMAVLVVQACLMEMGLNLK
jgi:HEPN domain-containing protein